ncbi:MAG: coproporphyrinogen dehydrogenase HemZ [Clostridia bacterium]
MSLQLKFQTDFESFSNDFLDICKTFYPRIELVDDGAIVDYSVEKVDEKNYNLRLEFAGNDEISPQQVEQKFHFDEILSPLKNKSLLKRVSKIFLYDFLSQLSGVALPYGSLTGIRPTKLFHEFTQEGIDARSYFVNELRVSEQKIDLIEEICNNQKKFYVSDEGQVDIFVNIPICVTRCVYCSFISAQLDKIKPLVQPYCDALVEELQETRRLVQAKNYKVRSVYVGGGTPTSLTAQQLDQVLEQCDFGCPEFTVEAGRPDTITREKLDAMARHNVTRISINPQTFCQQTLDFVGRKHSIQDIYDKFELARKYNFDINMDLIAMLPNENLETFSHSVDCAIALKPDNITVHTLAIKRGSRLKEIGYENQLDEELPFKMVDYAYAALKGAGYSPYYMYKQKYVSGNLENIGYCAKNKQCIYNIDIMEELNSIIANGAGGISKRVFPSQNRIERLPIPKAIEVYLERKEASIANKNKFFE